MAGRRVPTMRGWTAAPTSSVETMISHESQTRPRADALRLVTASSLHPDELVRVFNLAFSDYLVPMQMDHAAMAEHIANNDIDLECCRVALDVEPVGFTLVARRGSEAWIGGMGTSPAYRRIGLGARTLTAAIDAAAAAGADTVWLEVLDGNAPAVALYEQLGFERVRDLEIWSLGPDPGREPVEHRALDVDAAHAWIAGHRSGREPWQRADASIVRMRERGTPLVGVGVQRGDRLAGAAICLRDEVTVTVLQIAAVDRAAARDLVLAAAGDVTLRLANVPSDDVFSGVLRRLGAGMTVAQHEMRLRVSAEPPAEPRSVAAAARR
jgi:ribosomal protein S18 acetylase RimI-like enzyme